MTRTATASKSPKTKKNAKILVLSAAHASALSDHIQALNEHTASLRTAASLAFASNETSVRRILAEIWSVDDYRDVQDVEPLTDYITGGPASIMDFANTLRARIPGLTLQPGDLRRVRSVKTLIRAILAHLR